MKIPLKPILAGLGVAGIALYGAKKLYDSMSDSHISDCDDDREVETEFNETLHDIARYYLTDSEYARLCEMANSDSDLSENEEYLALEAKAKAPIIRALDSVSFADYFVALVCERFNDDEQQMGDLLKSDENLHISSLILMLPFQDEMLKTLLSNELTGNQMAIFKRFETFMENFDCNKDKVRSIAESSEFSNDEKKRKIFKALSESECEFLENFEVVCGKAVEIIKDFLNKPLRGLYRK